MNKNDPFARVFSDAPRFEMPPVSNVRSGAVMGADPFAQVFSDIPRSEVPHDMVFDSDGDGFIDPWDCQPFNPEEDGFWGDVWKSVTSRVKQTTSRVKRATRVDYGRASARRSSVRRAVTRRAAPVTRRVRAAVTRRIAPVTRRVRTAVARAPIHVSRERAADRRATVTRAVSARAAPVTAAVRAAVARAPIHPSGERAVARRADLASAFGVDFGRAADRRAAVVSGISAAAARMSPIGVAAAAPGQPDKPGEARQRMIDAGVLKDRPTTLTTGVGGVPGQPDRAGDVHAYVGIPTTPPGSRGEDALGAGEGAPGERTSFWGIDFDLAAERRGEIFKKGIWGAPKQVLAGISDMSTQPREAMESNIEAVTARQQAKFQPGTLSDLTTGFSEKLSRVATVARRFEGEDQVAYVPDVAQKYLGAPAQFTVPSVKSVVYGAEDKLGLHAEWLPAPVKTVGWAAKEVVYGAAFSGTAGAVEMVGMVPAGFETMARRPDVIPAAVAVGLVTMGKGMYHGAITSPTRMAGEFATFGAVMKAPSLSPVKVKLTTVKFPEAKGVGLGLEVRRGGVTKFEPAITVMPRAEKLVTIGTPKVIEAAIVGKTPFTPKTALEAKIVAKSLGREGAKVTEARAVRWETGRAGVKIKEVKPTVTEVLKHHEISGKSASAVIKTIKSHKGDLYGSIIQRAAAKEALARIPRDFDVVVKDPIKFAKDVAARINKAEGRQVVVAKDGAVTVRKTGEKLFDIHSKEVEPGTAYGREEIGWGLLPEKMTTVEGVRMRSFSEQLSRKLEGGMIVGQKRTLESPLGSVTGRIVPKHEGRIKDILDFYTGEKVSIKRLQERGKTKSAAKAEKHLERWLDTWGGDVAGTIRSISKEQIETGVVTKFAFRLDEPGVTRAAAEAAYRGYPAYAPASARPSVPPAAYPSIPPSTQPYRPPSAPPYRPPSTPPSMRPSVPPSAPPSMPPSISPYALPSVAPSAPPSMRPSVITSVLPSGLPYTPLYTSPSAPPSTPPSVPPSIPPSVPPSVPPSSPPSVPPSPPPSTLPLEEPIIVTAPPPPTTTKKHLRDKKKEKEKPLRRLKPRGPFDWFLKHEMVTLEGFLGGVAKPATGAFPEPDLGSPVAAKAGGGRARRPGLLDVPPGW